MTFETPFPDALIIFRLCTSISDSSLAYEHKSEFKKCVDDNNVNRLHESLRLLYDMNISNIFPRGMSTKPYSQ